MATGEIKTLLFSDGVSVATPTPVSSGKTLTDTAGWNGTTTTSVVYDVTSLNLPDATQAFWVFLDSTRKQIFPDVAPTGTQQVTVTAGEVLPSGTYYLMGFY